jgi:hypothetical protein
MSERKLPEGLAVKHVWIVEPNQMKSSSGAVMKIIVVLHS